MKNRIKGKFGSIYYFGYEDPANFRDELDLEENAITPEEDEEIGEEEPTNPTRMAG